MFQNVNRIVSFRVKPVHAECLSPLRVMRADFKTECSMSLLKYTFLIATGNSLVRIWTLTWCRLQYCALRKFHTDPCLSNGTEGTVCQLRTCFVCWQFSSFKGSRPGRRVEQTVVGHRYLHIQFYSMYLHESIAHRRLSMALGFYSSINDPVSAELKYLIIAMPQKIMCELKSLLMG